MAQQVNVFQSNAEWQWSLPVKFDAADGVVGAGGAAAVLTIAADANSPIFIKAVIFGYSAAPTGGSIKIEDGAGNVVFPAMPITGAGMFEITFDPPRGGSANTAMVITLASPGGAVVGTIWANVWRHN